VAAKEFPNGDWHVPTKGQKCSRWKCGKPAVKSRKTGQGELGACSKHYAEMKKGS